MSRRRPDQTRRGEHKKAASPETQRWVRDHLIPARPGWMSVEEYRRLAELRERLP
jgi:hypothetical protein